MTAIATVRAATPRRPGIWQRTRKTRTAYLFLLPALLVMAIITFYPLVFQVWMSFTDYGLTNLKSTAPPPNLVGFTNYQRILNNNIVLPNFDFVRILVFNLWWALSNVVIHVVLGVAIALLLNVEGLKAKRFYRAIFILPVVIPPIIVATVWKNMFDPQYGAVNLLFNGTIGALFKLPPVTLDWINQPNPIFQAGPFILPLAYFALLAANSWLGWPLNSVVATGALQSVPKDLYEAAEMDGAGWWAQFKTVTLPFLRPAMLPYAIYGFVITFNLFYLSYFMSGGGPFGQTELLVTVGYRLVAEQHLYGVAAAFAVFQFFILLTITIVTNRLGKATAAADA
ncbi:MAG: arabinogalactan oligomer / maltooligosaccharide transport system permease protein [Chloroflexota bacterium]|jgi:arabinogalactan oligomer/maltooligosaccharide transport system permease protein|nr:arabinogalactan oligomer / maltooligosaccharide transport system permease protein [Chloroflexota bacterium]